VTRKEKNRYQANRSLLRWNLEQTVGRKFAGASGLAPVAVGSENYQGPFTDSYLGFLKGLYAKKRARHYRSIGKSQFGSEVVDESVQQRRRADRSCEPQNNGLSKLT
jgi:hypothetical protein